MTPPPELSMEIVLFHILPKLPTKSLLRFKCVCKQWRSFLATPFFANIHLHQVTTVDGHRHEKVLFLCNRLASTTHFRTINCKDCLLAKPRCYPFVGYASILKSSVNGLVCVGIRTRNTDEFHNRIILWNPLTGEYKRLPLPIDRKCYSRKSIAFELYYTCSDDDYKILSITIDRNVYMYSLRSDSWMKLESTLDHEDRISYAGDHNLLDEKLHFLMPLKTKRGCIIIRLDLKTEKFTKIAVPYDDEHGWLSLMVVRGCIELTLFAGLLRRAWMIEVWRMSGDGDWTKMGKVSYSHSHGRVVKCCFMNPLSINGNWLGYLRTESCTVDLENYIEEDLCYMDVLPEIYIETFVSPNQHTIKSKLRCPSLWYGVYNDFRPYSLKAAFSILIVCILLLFSSLKMMVSKKTFK